MQTILRLGGLAGVIAGATLLLLPSQKQSSSSTSAPKVSVEYKVFNAPASVAYTLTIPQGSGYIIRPYLSKTLETVAQVAQSTGAVAVMNAGFFDPINQKTTSRVVLAGHEIASPQNNERLMQNPKLSPYLSAILNRSEFRQYRCGSQTQYDIVTRKTVVPAGCELEQAIAGGPQLLPTNTAEQEGFTSYNNGTLIRDAIGTTQQNARTAIGLTKTNSVVWVMVAQKENAGGGMTLAEVGALLRKLRVVKALNLDGGSSSSLYYRGQAHYGKLSETNQAVSRPVKSMFLLEAHPASNHSS